MRGISVEPVARNKKTGFLAVPVMLLSKAVWLRLRSSGPEAWLVCLMVQVY